MIEIFPLEISDLLWLKEQTDTVFNYGPISLETYCKWFSKGVMADKIGFREPKAIIMYKIEELYKDNKQRAVEVVNLLVSEENKRKGYGSLLKNALFNKYSNVRYFQGWVNTKNIPMINLNKKLGYEIVDENKNYYKNGDNAFVMIKDRNKTK